MLLHARSHPPVTVRLRIAVAPKDQADFVAKQGNSARFKYLIGKKSGVKPGLAQNLSVKSVSDSGLLEAEVNVETKEQAKRYAEAFVEILQGLCGGNVHLTLAEQSTK